MLQKSKIDWSASHAEVWDIGKRANNFDFLRFCLATLVVFSHSWPLLLGGQGEQRFEPLKWLSKGQMTLGMVAVDCFFVISGMLITRSWERSRSALSFLENRARRIYPGFAGAALVAWCLFGFLGAAHPGQYWIYLDASVFIRQVALLQIVRVPDLFPHAPLNHDLNGAAWTIRYEAAAYFLTMCLGLLGLLRRRGVVLALFAVALWWYWQQNWGSLPILRGEDWWANLVPLPWRGNWGRFLSCFLAGSAFYLWRDRIPRDRNLFYLSLMGVLAIYVYGEALLGVPLFGAYALFYLGFSARVPALQRWGRHGDFSYGIYLYAWPVQQLLVQYCHDYLNPWTLFLLAFPIALFFAVWSWKLVESRFLTRRSFQEAIWAPAPLAVPA